MTIYSGLFKETGDVNSRGIVLANIDIVKTTMLSAVFRVFFWKEETVVYKKDLLDLFVFWNWLK